MFTEEFIFGLIAVSALFILGWVGRMMPLRILSSLGMLYLGFDWYLRTSDLFGLGMMVVLAFSLTLVGRPQS